MPEKVIVLFVLAKLMVSSSGSKSGGKVNHDQREKPKLGEAHSELMN